jgi:hypothetical protein
MMPFVDQSTCWVTRQAASQRCLLRACLLENRSWVMTTAASVKARTPTEPLTIATSRSSGDLPCRCPSKNHGGDLCFANQTCSLGLQTCRDLPSYTRLLALQSEPCRCLSFKYIGVFSADKPCNFTRDMCMTSDMLKRHLLPVALDLE